MCKCVSFYNNRYTLYKYSKDFLLLFFKKEKDKNAVKLCEKNLFSAFLFIKYSVRFFRSNQFFLHLVSNRQIYYMHFHYWIQLFHGKEFAAHTFRFPFYFFIFFCIGTAYVILIRLYSYWFQLNSVWFLAHCIYNLAIVNWTAIHIFTLIFDNIEFELFLLVFFLLFISIFSFVRSVYLFWCHFVNANSLAFVCLSREARLFRYLIFFRHRRCCSFIQFLWHELF